jgi:tRNA threonylcarbamoyladenosine biosynthesis protein TsaB
MILCIETATPVCSVALCDSAGFVLTRENHENKSHASLLTVFIMELLEQTGLKASELEAVAVSKGPGSYTGLRIGVSAAKGIAYGASIPLLAVDTTRSMFNGIIEKAEEKFGTDETSLFCPMIDARRMEVYYSLFAANGNEIKGIAAEVITETSFVMIPENVRIVFFGDGAKKCQGITGHKNQVFADDFEISAAFMQKTAFLKLKEGHFEDIAYFEPFYLKEFVATIPRKNILF